MGVHELGNRARAVRALHMDCCCTIAHVHYSTRHWVFGARTYTQAHTHGPVAHMVRRPRRARLARTVPRQFKLNRVISIGNRLSIVERVHVCVCVRIMPYGYQHALTVSAHTLVCLGIYVSVVSGRWLHIKGFVSENARSSRQVIALCELHRTRTSLCPCDAR